MPPPPHKQGGIIVEYKPLLIRLLEEDYDWLDRHSFETKLSKAEIVRRGLELYREREVKSMTIRDLQELTGRESGVVVYRNEGILCNWTGISGLPRMFATGLVGAGEDIPDVPGERVDDLAPYLEGVEIAVAVSNYSEDDHPLESGTVYDLGNDVLVIAPDGWI